MINTPTSPNVLIFSFHVIIQDRFLSPFLMRWLIGSVTWPYLLSGMQIHHELTMNTVCNITANGPHDTNILISSTHRTVTQSSWYLLGPNVYTFPRSQ